MAGLFWDREEKELLYRMGDVIMCIMSDKDIREALEKKEIVVEPLNIDEQLGPSSLDLRLGNKVRVFKSSMLEYIDTKSYKDEYVSEYVTNSDVKVVEYENSILYENIDSFVIHPGEFVLASTLERIELPSHIVGRLEGRSSLGRLGLIVHATAGYIDPGFRGNITLEIGNVGKLPIKIYSGMRICQVVFEKMCSPAEKPYNAKEGSKYIDERGATPSRISYDFLRS